jgi:hypothetical protein
MVEISMLNFQDKHQDHSKLEVHLMEKLLQFLLEILDLEQKTGLFKNSLKNVET